MQKAYSNNNTATSTRCWCWCCWWCHRPTANIGRTGCCCIFINQLREKIGVMFGNPETTTGGNALKFYASVRLDIRKSGAALKDKEGNLVGNQVKVVKNKLVPPFRIAQFDIIFGEGISKVGEIVDLGAEYDIIQKSGAWYAYNGAKIAQGRDAAKQFLKDNPEVALEVKEKLASGNVTKQAAALALAGGDDGEEAF